MEDTVRNVIIPHLIAELSKEGIAGLGEYERRLQDNAGNEEVLGDLLFEADAALMFSRHGFKATVRERPDLRIDWNDEAVYAEVKHFREKEQDRTDEQTMQRSEDLVPTGILTLTEGCEAWEQIAKVAIGKVDQYKEDAPNILVVATNSNSVDGSILPIAVHIYDERANSDPRLHRLNAFMLMDQWHLWIKELSVEKNVYFYQTTHTKTPMSEELIKALASIHRWSTPRNITSIRHR
jgi:hypothetical protein